ncbi:MAG: Zn-ribbon domain-containing OB-fold protein [Armatimonadota bacterium]|nr:Zn-ribbon domain-containing OB-fold protein [Armatimonadota bacterium]MDR7427558.1 Zn-ribbon domain-containing OB-fold protein [Armatimonadota bacterium]MDR7464723.1 Zn-ribbon domain-containing OB-fold protein [Armatimonadota bacterium]MDR7469785.1 Zn-ribbon domain-containing OB-fold protein [Armatimonadota bacterium]MDR7474684.1 Zn-ribbon domain-containing OB-fold protein [Armatimonadota bacterium]
MVEVTETGRSGVVPVHPDVFAGELEGEPQLVGSRCRQCGARFFPRRGVCARCLSAEVEVVPLGRVGTLHTYTVVYQSTPEFPTPYILAYVDLPEGVRLLAPLAGVPVDQVRIGMPLRLQVEPLRTDAAGRTVLGYRLYAHGGGA